MLPRVRHFYDELASQLSSLEFRRNPPMSFVREYGRVTDYICPTVRNTSQHSFISCSIKIRFHELEPVFSELAEGESYLTANAPLHILMGNDFHERHFGEIDDVAPICNDIKVNVESHALPIFARYKKIEDFANDLLNDCVDSAFVLSAHQKLVMLAGNAVLSGKFAEATRFMEIAITDPRHSSMGMQVRLDMIKTRIDECIKNIDQKTTSGRQV